jgi:hypothetical protein
MNMHIEGVATSLLGHLEEWVVDDFEGVGLDCRYTMEL